MARQICHAHLLSVAIAAAIALGNAKCFSMVFLPSADSSIPVRGFGDYRQKQGGRPDSAYVRGVGYLALLSGIIAISSKSSRRKAKRLLRNALDAACHAVVQMTPTGKHLGRMMPHTPMLFADANKMCRKEERLVTIEEGDMENCGAVDVKSNSTPSALLTPVQSSSVVADSSPVRIQRNSRRVRSFRGWTPAPLSCDDIEKTLDGDSEAVEGEPGCGSGSEDGSLPSKLELRRIFNRLLELEGESTLGIATMQAAVDDLNARCDFGFDKTDTTRLYTFLSQGRHAGISREDFVAGLGDLLKALQAVRPQLSLQQLRVVMASAFERFDVNGDGTICVEEFAAALQASDMKLKPSDIQILYRFLSQTGCSKLSSESNPFLERANLTAMEQVTSLEEQCNSAIDGAVNNLARTTGLKGAVEMATRVANAVGRPGSPEERASRGLAAALGSDQVSAGHLADASELAASIAGASLMLWHVHVHSPAECLTSSDMLGQLNSVIQSLQTAVEDLLQAGPLGPVLLSGLLGAAKALPSKELGALDHDEALLFARSFHNRGCSQAVFHKMLASGSCRWASAEAGESLTTSAGIHELRILVRGKGSFQRAGSSVEEVPLGSAISTREYSQEGLAGSANSFDIVAVDQVKYVAWDLHQLEEYLANAEDERLTDLVHELKEEARCLAFDHSLQNPAFQGFSHQSPACRLRGGVEACHIEVGSPPGWFSPVGAAIHCQARRKGISRCSQLSNNLRHVLSKPTASQSERVDQCLALIWDSAEEVMESLEATADLAGACSALAALVGSSTGLSPDDLLQLAPLLILLSLTGAQAARKGIADLADGRPRDPALASEESDSCVC